MRRHQEFGGELARARRGVYSRPANGSDAGEDRHRLLARASWGELDGGATISHQSAAILHGLPLLGPTPTRVAVTRPAGGHGRADTHLHLRLCPIEPDEIVELAGMLVTSVARTVVDLARSSSFDRGVLLADAALHLGLDPAELADSLNRARGRPGIARARRVASFADGRSESPGESLSRVRIHQAGLPAPELQWEVSDGQGHRYLADFGWLDRRTLGEFDGKVKYDRLLRPGQTAADAVMAEKRRENRIRAQGWWLVRWGWDDLADVQGFGRIIRQAFANAPRG